ncbi:MAG: hypothetical protein WCP46_05075 [Alphaproteobacteria bacterium]
MMNEMTEMPVEGLLELPDCAPTKVLPQDLGNAITGKDTQKYYASTLLGIKGNEITAPELFAKESNNEILPIKAEFVRKVIGLLSENDVCDKIGIKFLAKAYADACSVENNEFWTELCKEIKKSKSAVAKLAILYEGANKR